MTKQLKKQARKIKWQDWSALGLFLAFVLIMPITNALLAGLVNEGLRAFTNLVDNGFAQLSIIGMIALQPIVTLLIVYTAWRMHGFTKHKIPTKSKGKDGMKYEVESL